jgi:hypothetical protein
MRTLEILFATALCLLISGCVSTLPQGSSSMSPAPACQDPALPIPAMVSYSGTGEPPSVFVISPPFDGGIMAGNVTIVVEVTNFTLVSPGGKNSAATGHLIYYQDVVPQVLEGVPAFTRPGTYGVSSETTFGWEGITPGTHTFAVQLVNADNTPLNPMVVDATDVTAVVPGMITDPET